jgi:tight adherence protein B
MAPGAPLPLLPSPGLAALGHLGAALVVVGAASALAVALSEGGALRRALLRHERALDEDLGFVRSRVDARSVLLCQGAITAVLLAAPLLGAPLVVLPLVVPVIACPRLLVHRARAARSELIDAQLDRWLLALSTALSSTGALGEALATSVRAVQAPLSEEIERVLAEHRLGMPLDRALEAFASRGRTPLVRGAVATLTIARNVGGDPRVTLESAAATLREVARLEGVVRAKIAEGKAQAVVVSVVPAPLVAAVHFMAPEFFAPLGRSVAGALVVAGACLLWLGAIALAVKIAAVDV